jgi:radical SAM-linked protein
MSAAMRLRVRFSKQGKIRFTSHRDVARIWERALRRAAVPVAYTEGFSPHPKLSFGLALPTGAESLGEYLDVDLAARLDDNESLESLPGRLDPCLPAGMVVQAVAEIEPRTPSLQQAVVSCTWRIEVDVASARLGNPGGAGSLTERVERLLAADSLVTTRERKGQPVTDDLRPALLSLALVSVTPAGSGTLEAELATQPRGLRPSELVALLDDASRDQVRDQMGDQVQERRACRLHQWMIDAADGARREPLELPRPALVAPHAELRAS